MAVYNYCEICQTRVTYCAGFNGHKAQKSHVWRIDVQPGGRKHKRLRETRLTKELAEAREREILYLYQRGELFVGEKKPRNFGEACDHYRAAYMNPKKQQHDEYAVKLFERLIGRTTQLSEITKESCRTVYNRLRVDVSMATVVRRWTVLYGIFRENQEFTTGNPAKGIIEKRDRRLADRQKIVYFTDEEYKILLTTAKTEEMRDIILIFRNTGFRRHEGAALRFEHCDFTTNTIHVIDQKNGEQGSIPMVPAVRQRLIEIEHRLGRNTGPVLDLTNIGRRFRKVVKDAKLYKPYPYNKTLHSLRHSWGTYIQRNYKDLNTTKELMRHKSIRMTLRYSHAADELKRAAAIAGAISVDIPSTKKVEPSEKN